jgi:hypothetical protein
MALFHKKGGSTSDAEDMSDNGITETFDSTSSQEEEEEEESSEDSAPHSESSEENGDGADDVWREIFTLVCNRIADKLPEELETSQDMLQEPFFGIFFENTKQVVAKILHMASKLESDSESFAAIKKTADSYIETNKYDNMTDSEALEKAFDKREYLIKDLLSNHIDVVEENLFSNESDESSGEQEVSSDSEEDAGVIYE